MSVGTTKRSNGIDYLRAAIEQTGQGVFFDEFNDTLPIRVPDWVKRYKIKARRDEFVRIVLWSPQRTQRHYLRFNLDGCFEPGYEIERNNGGGCMSESITLEQARAKERELERKLADAVKQFVLDTGLEPSISFAWRSRCKIFSDERVAYLLSVSVSTRVDDRADVA